MIHNAADFEIIDAHTHPFLDPADCIGAYGQPKSMAEFDAEMKKVGSVRYAGSVISVRRANDGWAGIKGMNEDALRIRDQFPGYIPGIQVHGGYPQESCEELHRMYDQGVRMVGELVPYSLHTENFNSPGMITIFKEMEKLNMLASVHHGTRGELLPVLEACPDLKIMMAHPGEPWGDEDMNSKKRLEFVAQHKNLYMDISGYGPHRWGMIRWAIDLCGAEKIIFGSDMPTCPAGMYLYAALCENLTDAELRLLLAGNFKRLIGE